MAVKSVYRFCRRRTLQKPFSIAWRRSCVDARELLRRYLEQRRELGENELVLDSLSVDEALRILGALRGGSPHASRLDAPATTEGSDWRTALRAAGAEPTRQPSPSAAPQKPSDDRSIRETPVSSI